MKKKNLEYFREISVVGPLKFTDFNFYDKLYEFDE